MTPPWMSFYPADYLADTGHLSTLEHGAYFLLILHYWQKGGLPNDDRKLARITRLTDSEWTSIRDTIAEFFDGDWQHFRIDAELATAREKHEARAEAGSKGGKASWTKRKSKQCFSNASAMLNQPQPQPHSSEADASDAKASAREALWGNGVSFLMALGVSETRAKPMIGRWLKDAGDNYARVLGAIDRARSEAPIDPIAWITASLKTYGKSNGKPENLSAVARRFAEQGINFGPKPGLAGVGGEADGNSVRMLPEGRCKRS